MAHLLEVKGEARHLSDLFYFFRGECVKSDALVMCCQDFLLKSEMQRKGCRGQEGTGSPVPRGVTGPSGLDERCLNTHCGTKLLHTVTFRFFSIVCL